MSEIYDIVMKQLNQEKGKNVKYVYLEVYKPEHEPELLIKINYDDKFFIIGSENLEPCIDYIKNNFSNDNMEIYVNPTPCSDILFSQLKKHNIFNAVFIKEDDMILL